MYDLYRYVSVLQDPTCINNELQLMATDITEELVSRIIYELSSDYGFVTTMQKSYG